MFNARIITDYSEITENEIQQLSEQGIIVEDWDTIYIFKKPNEMFYQDENGKVFHKHDWTFINRIDFESDVAWKEINFNGVDCYFYMTCH